MPGEQTRDDQARGVSSATVADAAAEASAEPSAGTGWARSCAYLVVAVVVGITIIMPFAGLTLALAGVCYLRAGDAAARRMPARVSLLHLLAAPVFSPAALARGAATTLLTLPIAAVFAVAVPLGCVMLALLDIETDPLTSVAWGAGLAVYVLWAGPGLRVPRRHLVRLFDALAGDPRRGVVVGGLLALLGLLTVAAIAGVVTLRPDFTPMYEFKNYLTQTLTRWQDSIHQRVS